MSGNKELLSDKTGEVRELTAEDLKRFQPAQKKGRPPVDNPKVPVTIRLDADVVEKFKRTGKGWQTRINEALKQFEV